MLDLLGQVRWQDLLDIAIVSIIIYKVLLLVKGTEAAQMIVGLVILLIAAFFSEYFQLYTIDWLIQSFWAHVVIVLIILFHPEIRTALAQIGGKSLFLYGFASAEGLKSLDEIIKAVKIFADRKIGALIIFERNIVLEGYIEIGTTLDAKVSKELLLSIFHPSSPIHDGAVVIKGNRIIAAGCFLPIILGDEAGKTFGTRHRAGISVTKETDAVAVIVSEEAGIISVAMREKIETDVDINRLRDTLTLLFAKTEEKKKNPLKRYK
ncbi:diadenylate cyclase CdaA [Thermodesulfovibrionales bacterium]|nr:diadenylate cyclase CdaA [Thermodesulfovibrionales bacterium]MCL0040258.1 diadenylate cyclase CdaA [Thermodesulfovibrionales bacterium]MCL0042718.1 diadenylate cyclase CdaA [Thermodesulfovibrionales bacterium]MCL0061426.1 diadenylate cyclase CdaA [Thermodesulfovibrionales bacterium]MCL0067250.1 diadenylate cyclase CdaA [Thermodesulfovibrionales bacterium]